MSMDEALKAIGVLKAGALKKRPRSEVTEQARPIAAQEAPVERESVYERGSALPVQGAPEHTDEDESGLDDEMDVEQEIETGVPPRSVTASVPPPAVNTSVADMRSAP